MKNNDNPLMAAYIAFLAICGIYYMMSNLFNFDFPLWNRIVAAATISSYFFSISALVKYKLKTGQTLIETLTRDKTLLEHIRLEKVNVIPDTDQKDAILKESDRLITESAESINRLSKEIPKYEKSSVVCDITAYLLFFCILTFETLYNFFAESLDFYTLLAFVILMVTQYNENKYSTQYKKILYSAIDNMDKYIDHLELKIQGD